MAKKNFKPDVFSTIEPLNHVLKVFGLSSITRSEGKIQYSWSNYKITLIISVLLVAIVCNIYIRFQTIILGPALINFSTSIQLIYLSGYFQYIVDVYFVCMYRKDYLDYYCLYEYIDTVLGVPRYTQIRTTFLHICSVYIFSGGAAIVVDYIGLILCVGWINSTIYYIDYFFIILKVISALDMISHVIQVSYRLKIIGNSLNVFYDCDHFKLRSLAAQKMNRLDNLRIVCFNHSDNILWLRRCYLLLIEQCDFFNTAYGFRVVVNNLIFLFDLVMVLNLMIRQIIGTLMLNITYGVQCIIIASNVMRITTSMCILLCGVHHCEQNYRETERIVRSIDDLIINKKTGNEERESLKEFKNLIITRPVKFKAMNFYRLDYPCFVSIASAIVTYTIILLQSLK